MNKTQLLALFTIYDLPANSQNQKNIIDVVFSLREAIEHLSLKHLTKLQAYRYVSDGIVCVNCGADAYRVAKYWTPTAFDDVKYCYKCGKEIEYTQQFVEQYRTDLRYYLSGGNQND